MARGRKSGSSIVALLQGAFYETIYLCAKDTNVRPWFFILSIIVDFLQLLAFPLQLIFKVAEANTSGMHSLLESLLSWLSFTQQAIDKLGQGLWLFIYVVSVLWTGTLVGLVALIGYNFSIGASQSPLSLRILRAMGMLSGTILFLPLLSLLLQTFQCTHEGNWVVFDSLQCFEGLHIGVSVAVLILVPLFVGLAIFMGSVFFDRDIRSNVISAQVHGRGDVAMLANKVVLSFFFSLMLSSVTPWIGQLLLIVSSATFVSVYLVSMPYVQFKINELKSACAFGYSMACIASLVVLVQPMYDTSLFLFLGVPLAFIGGALQCRIIHDGIIRKPFNMLQYSYELSIWARKRIHIYEALKSEYLRFDRFASASEEDADESTNLLEDASNEKEKKCYRIPATESRMLQLGNGYADTTTLEELRDQIEKAYQGMVERFPSSGNVLLESSTFFRHYRDNLYMEMRILSQAQKKCSAPDIRFVVYQRLRQMRESSSSSSSHELNAVDRVLFDQKWRSASSEETKVYQVVFQLWNSLMAPAPALGRLQDYAKRLTKAMTQADNYYRECLRLNPESVIALRGYGGFIRNLKGDEEQSNEYFNKADRIEEAVGTDKRSHLPNFHFKGKFGDVDANDESSAVIVISGDPSRIGEIVEANSAACSLFGISSGDLIGNDITVVIPKPFSILHNSYLVRFGATGKGVMMNCVRSMLALNGSSHLIPIVMRVREVPPRQGDPNAAPRFSAVMNSPKTDEHFILFDNEKQKYQILHADSLSFSDILGISAEELDDDEHFMGDFFPDLKVATDDNSTTTGNDKSHNSSMNVRDYCTNQAETQEKARQFLKSLRSRSEHASINVKKRAGRGYATILGRVQEIPVNGYGSVFLLAWKKKARTTVSKKKRESKKNETENKFHLSTDTSKCPVSGASGAGNNDGGCASQASVDVQAQGNSAIRLLPDNRSSQEIVPAEADAPQAQGHLPSLSNEQNSESGSINDSPDNGATAGHVAASPYSGTVLKAKKNVKIPEALIPPFQQNAHSAKADADANGTVTVSQSTGKSFQTADESINGMKTESKGWGGSQGQSSIGTTGSVRRLLQHVIAQNITGVKPIVKKARYVVVASVLAFALFSIVARVELSRTNHRAIEHTESIHYGSFELTSFISLQTSLFLAHLPNSEFKDTVGTTEHMWSSVVRNIDRFMRKATGSTRQVFDIGGTPAENELNEMRPVVNKFTGEREQLSTVEIRDFVFAHLRELKDKNNGSNLVPGQTTHEVQLLMDNAVVAKDAFNASSTRRIEYFRKVVDDYVLNIAMSMFLVLVFIAGTVAVSLVYAIWVLTRNRKEILKSFMLIPLKFIKRMRGTANKALKTHLEQVHNAELLGEGESDDDNNSEEFGEGDEGIAGAEKSENDQENQPQSLAKTHSGKINKKHNIVESEQAVSEATKSTRRKSKHSQKIQYTESGKRRYRYSKKFLYTSLAKALAPLALLIGWCVFVYGVNVSTLSDLESEAAKVRIKENSMIGWIDFEQDVILLSLRAGRGSTRIGNATLEAREFYRRNALFQRNSAVERMTTLLNGRRDVLPEPRSDSVEHEVWTENACFLFGDKHEHACLKTALKHGLRAYVRSFLNRGLDILGKLPGLEVGNDDALAYLKNRKWLQQDLKHFHEMLFPLALEATVFLVGQSLEESNTIVQRSIRQQEVATAAFVICFTLSLLFITMPTIEKVGSSLNAAFNLLVLIPEDLLSSAPQLRSHIKDITEKLAASEDRNDATTLLATQQSGGKV
eukprot:gb/GECG01013013.1/.p1 GENE.gb/GECG01013013.1/~~gb/GECG01013013.1/.p1  ORF type:complete len:1765 (+),score=203.56 gb/GECG01013013.1/:1-5295(+)